ncbi:MAG: methyltransferase domain-containing protein [Myxococcota bacterium]
MDEIVRSETEKYRLAHAKAYRDARSQGLQVAPYALRWARRLGARSVTDWGSGTGVARDLFRSSGFRSVGIDLVPEEAGDERAETWTGTIWDPPDDFPITDFAFSADVLEHLPPDKVLEAVASIRDHTRLGGWMQISTRPDRLGSKIGETLHLTVRPSGWWEAELSRCFSVVRVVHTKKSQVRLWLRR